MSTTTTATEREEIRKERQRERIEEGRKYAADRFNVPLDHITGTNSGAAYSKVWVNNEESAKKISAAIKAEGRTANGGWYDGMPLGGISPTGDGNWEVMI